MQRNKRRSLWTSLLIGLSALFLIATPIMADDDEEEENEHHGHHEHHGDGGGMISEHQN